MSVSMLHRLRSRRGGVGLAVSVVAEVEKVKEVEGETGAVGTLV